MRRKLIYWAQKEKKMYLKYLVKYLNVLDESKVTMLVSSTR